MTLENKSVPELKDLLKLQGLAVSGRKADLIALREYLHWSKAARAKPQDSNQ
jgi:ribosome-associated protein YbcJ (S4-like RNA binding protein)